MKNTQFIFVFTARRLSYRKVSTCTAASDYTAVLRAYYLLSGVKVYWNPPLLSSNTLQNHLNVILSDKKYS